MNKPENTGAGGIGDFFVGLVIAIGLLLVAIGIVVALLPGGRAGGFTFAYMAHLILPVLLIIPAVAAIAALFVGRFAVAMGAFALYGLMWPLQETMRYFDKQQATIKRQQIAKITEESRRLVVSAVKFTTGDHVVVRKRTASCEHFCQRLLTMADAGMVTVADWQRLKIPDRTADQNAVRELVYMRPGREPDRYARLYQIAKKEDCRGPKEVSMFGNYRAALRRKGFADACIVYTKMNMDRAKEASWIVSLNDAAPEHEKIDKYKPVFTMRLDRQDRGQMTHVSTYRTLDKPEAYDIFAKIVGLGHEAPVRNPSKGGNQPN